MLGMLGIGEIKDGLLKIRDIDQGGGVAEKYVRPKRVRE